MFLKNRIVNINKVKDTYYIYKDINKLSVIIKAYSYIIRKGYLYSYLKYYYNNCL